LKGDALLDDRDIIALMRSGNSDSFSEMVERYQAQIRRYLFRVTGDYFLAQDLAQETFVNAYQGILKTKTEISFKSWLYRIATNNAYQYLRHKKLVTFVPQDDTKEQQPQDSVDSSNCEDRIAVEEALLKIPKEHRTCILLHWVEGLKYVEIGAILGITEEAARKRVTRGSEEFKKVFIEAEGLER
jgi:RNA polymerase sigma-70 factor (ECF subfamily)